MSPADRAAIAAALLRSLDEGPDDEPEAVEAAWAEEIRLRVQALDAGTAKTLSPEAARRSITADVEDRSGP